MSTAGRFPMITPEALAALRARIGQPVRRPEPYIEVATRDAIRHWAHGIGDRHPFWAEAGVAPDRAAPRATHGPAGPTSRALYRGRDAGRHPPLGPRHRRPQSVLGRGRRGA